MPLALRLACDWTLRLAWCPVRPPTCGGIGVDSEAKDVQGDGMMNPVSRREGVELIKTWGYLFDVHASPSVIYDYTAGEAFCIIFGETRFCGLAGLGEHHPLKEPFTEENHLYYDYQMESLGHETVMTTRMVWDTRRRTGQGGLEHLIADLRHRWTFVRLPDDGRAVFLTHELLSLAYRPGYVPSEVDKDNLHLDAGRVAYRRD